MYVGILGVHIHSLCYCRKPVYSTSQLLEEHFEASFYPSGPKKIKKHSSQLLELHIATDTIIPIFLPSFIPYLAIDMQDKNNG